MRLRESTAVWLFATLLILQIATLLISNARHNDTLEARGQSKQQRDIIQNNQERLECILLKIPTKERSPEAFRRVCGETPN